MKFLIVLVASLILINQPMLSQEGWFWQNPLPQGNSLYDIEVLSNEKVVIVGYTGTILISEDGGQNWIVEEQLSTNMLESVDFVDENYGWAVGDQGAAIFTTNGGMDWATKDFFTGSNFMDVEFVSIDIGWIVGTNGYLIKTTNAGANWSSKNIGVSSDLMQVEFITADTGFIITRSSEVLKTIDGGESWQLLNTGLPFASYYSLDFINSTQGWIVGEAGSIITTTDGGISWISQSYPTVHILCEIKMVSAFEGWVVSEHGTFLHTTNSGTNWILITDTLYASSINFSQSGKSWIVSGSRIFYSPDYWVTWQLQSSGFITHLNGVYFVNTQEGWVVGDEGKIYKTSDGGVKWQLQISNTQRDLYTLFFYDESIGWAGGAYGRLIKTTDGGSSWVVLNSPTNYDIESIQFLDSLVGYIPDGDRVLKTVDGGESWESISTNNEEVYEIYFTNSLKGWAVGPKILHTTNGGQSWSIQYGGGMYVFSDVCFISDTVGWAVGEHLCYHTTNGGENWTNLNTGINPRKVQFVSKLNGWALTSDYELLYSSDSGLIWVEQDSKTKHYLEDFFFLNEDEGYVVGTGGIILKTTTGGTTFVETDDYHSQPKTSFLSQNYPNPFNPSTTIRYEIPEQSFVTIKIYDILGNEIAKLVNEEKPAGSYEVEFNTSSINHYPSSGVYLYTISSGNFFSAKKMILLK